MMMMIWSAGVNNRQTRTLVTIGYIERRCGYRSGRGVVVFDNTDFRGETPYPRKRPTSRAESSLKSVTYRLPGDQQPPSPRLRE